MKKGMRILGVLALIIVCLTALLACAADKPVVSGLVIIDDQGQVAPLPAEDEDALAASFYKIVMRIARDKLPVVSQATDDKVRQITGDVARIIRETKPTEREYLALMSVLKRYEEEKSISVTYLIDNLYLDATAALGKDKCAVLVYKVLLFYCDYQAEKFEQRYEENKYSFLLQDAQRYRHKYDVLSTRLTPEDLAAGLNTYYIIAAVRSFANQKSATDAGFLTNEEILMLIKAQNSTMVALDDEVWYELLSLANDFVTHKYYKKWIETAMDNGDVHILARSMNDLISLVRHLQMAITEQDVARIQEGAPIANVLLSLLGDEQLILLDDILSGGWHYGKYEEYAREYYGERYDNFVARTETVSLERLLAERGGADNVTSLLFGYLAGKCYAVALEVRML